MLSICFLSGSLEFWNMLDGACLHDQAPQRPWPEPKERPSRHLTHVVTVAERIPLPPLFSFAVSALYPFIVINLSHEYEYILRYVSPSSKSPILGVVLKTPNIELKDLQWNALLCFILVSLSVLVFFLDSISFGIFLFLNNALQLLIFKYCFRHCLLTRYYGR